MSAIEPTLFAGSGCVFCTAGMYNQDNIACIFFWDVCVSAIEPTLLLNEAVYFAQPVCIIKTT